MNGNKWSKKKLFKLIIQFCSCRIFFLLLYEKRKFYQIEFEIKYLSISMKVNIDWFFFFILLHVLYGVKRFGSRGNMDVFLILSNPRYNITTRSMPIPPPACGGQPKRKASMYAAIFDMSGNFEIWKIWKKLSLLIIRLVYDGFGAGLWF